MLVVAVFVAIGLLGSIYSISKRNFLFAIGTSVAWFFLIAYTRVQPLPMVVAGSSVDSLFIGICVAFCIGTILSIFVLNNNDKRKESGEPPSEQEINRHNARGSGYESPEEYAAKLDDISHQRKRRR